MDLRGELAQVNLSPSIETFALMTELYVLAGDVKVLLVIANLPLPLHLSTMHIHLFLSSLGHCNSLVPLYQAWSCHKSCIDSRCCCIILKAYRLLGSYY